MVASVDVATPHTSDAKEPNVVIDRTVFVQTFAGIVEVRVVDAVDTVASVLLFIVVIADEIAPTVEAVPALILAESEVLALVISDRVAKLAPTVNVLSVLTKSIPAVPHVIVVGQVPSGPERGIR